MTASSEMCLHCTMCQCATGFLAPAAYRRWSPRLQTPMQMLASPGVSPYVPMLQHAIRVLGLFLSLIVTSYLAASVCLLRYLSLDIHGSCAHFRLTTTFTAGVTAGVKLLDLLSQEQYSANILLADCNLGQLGRKSTLSL